MIFKQRYRAVYCDYKITVACEVCYSLSSMIVYRLLRRLVEQQLIEIPLESANNNLIRNHFAITILLQRETKTINELGKKKSVTGGV